jgi:hypothetical protein
MESFTTWSVYPQADGVRLDALLECLGGRLSVDKPQVFASAVVLRGALSEITRALDECAPEDAWRDLLMPPT